MHAPEPVSCINCIWTLTLEDDSVRTFDLWQGSMKFVTGGEEPVLTFTYKETGDVEWFRDVKQVTVTRESSDGYSGYQNYFF